MAAALPFVMAAVGTIGAINQANAASAQAKSDQYAAEYNAKLNRRNSEIALRQGEAREALQRRQARKEAGNLRAGLIENGISLTEGTGADLVQESSLNNELDALNIRYDSQLRASGFQEGAALDDMSASAARQRGKEASKSKVFAVASGALQAYGGYQSYQANKSLTAARST